MINGKKIAAASRQHRACQYARGLMLGILILGAGGVIAQAFPTKPVRIVTSEPGGSNDFVARLIAQGLAGAFGQQVIVDNRAGGVIPGEILIRATPDGYTLLLLSGSLWIRQLLDDRTPYDAVKDFAPITLAVSSPNVLVVHPAVAANSVKELITLAKARPGALNYGSGSTGASTHLAAELFKSMAGVNIVRIPYKATGPALNDLLGGQVQLMFPTAAVAPHVKAGRLRALAITSALPSALFPNLPTVAASGLPGYDSVSNIGVFAPSATPAPLINRLNQEIVRTLNKADDREKYFNSGSEVIGSSPGQLTSTMKSDMTKLGKVIRDAGIRAD